MHLDTIREALPDAAKDLKINIQSVLKPERLTEAQTLGTALASAWFLASPNAIALAEALQKDAEAAGVDDGVIDDARAAAALMGMNTTYYRFRHLMGNDSAYAKMPPQLRMMRIAKHASDKATFELMSMACAALAGCEMCLQAHEQSLLKEGVSVEAIHDSVRIGSVVNGVVVAMGIRS